MEILIQKVDNMKVAIQRMILKHEPKRLKWVRETLFLSVPLFLLNKLTMAVFGTSSCMSHAVDSGRMRPRC